MRNIMHPVGVKQLDKRITEEVLLMENKTVLTWVKFWTWKTHNTTKLVASVMTANLNHRLTGGSIWSCTFGASFYCSKCISTAVTHLSTGGWDLKCPLTLTLKNLTKLSPKHAACGVLQSPYPIYRQGKACLSKQLPWRAAGDPRLARGRFRVRVRAHAGALRAFFSPPSLPPLGEFFFAPSPPLLWKC